MKNDFGKTRWRSTARWPTSGTALSRNPGESKSVLPRGHAVASALRDDQLRHGPCTRGEEEILNGTTYALKDNNGIMRMWGGALLAHGGPATSLIGAHNPCDVIEHVVLATTIRPPSSY